VFEKFILAFFIFRVALIFRGKNLTKTQSLIFWQLIVK